MPTFIYIDGGESLVPQAAGTAIGTMTGAGGLAAAFDGNNSQGLAASAAVPAVALVGYVGKDWGGPGHEKRITRVKAWASSDFGWNGNAANVSNITISLLGSNTNDPTTATTIFTGSTFADGNTAQPIDYDTSAGVTSYQYHWLKIVSSAARDICCAEIEFYQT